jgi:thymidylate synthase ThyX
METFTEQERQLLLNFCSNTDKPVFVLKNLPEAIKGALFSRYSRSTKPLRRLLLDEFLSSKESGLMDLVGRGAGPDLSAATLKAEDFYNRVLDGFGDDSVGELGGAHVAIEDVSIVSTKIIQDARVGGSPLEKSTRYVYFDQKRDGKWLYYREPKIMASRFGDEYLAAMDSLFEAYSRLVPALTKYVEEQWPIGQFAFAPDRASPPVLFGRLADENTIRRAKAAYSGAVRAKVCDALRYLLPAGTLTNMGFYGNGRFWQNLITRLYSHPLSEPQEMARSIHAELGTVIKPFVRRAKRDDYLASREERMEDARTLAAGELATGAAESKERVALVDYDANAVDKTVAACLYPYSCEPMQSLLEKASKMSDAQKQAVLDSYAGARKTRRDKPGRAFEQAYYEFDICADFGAYRDIHRHRILSQERQLLSCRHGFETPEELVQAGLEKEYSVAMDSAASLYNKLAPSMPHEAQYCVPLGYRIRWRMRMNLREAYHFCELRSGMQGHPSYRRVAQDVYRHINGVHPALAKNMGFVDMKEYPLGRINAEMGKENKRAAQ